MSYTSSRLNYYNYFTEIEETFVRRRGRVLTRAVLLDEVWGPGTHVTDRVVDTHVMKLRRKIESGRAPRYLIGVRGIGYRFDG